MEFYGLIAFVIGLGWIPVAIVAAIVLAIIGVL